MRITTGRSVRYQAVTHDGRGARRRPAVSGRRPRRRAGWGSGLEWLEARALLSLTPTAIPVSASSAAPAYGQAETFTATVTIPSGDPTPGPTDGTVTFYDGNTPLGTAQALSAANPPTATLTTSTLALGAHTITASYSGDGS